MKASTQNKEANTVKINITIKIPKGKHCISNDLQCGQKLGARCLAFGDDLTWDNDYKHLKKCADCLKLSANLA